MPQDTPSQDTTPELTHTEEKEQVKEQSRIVRLVESLRQIPTGGILKTTPGIARQIFDEDGELTWQEFIAGNEEVEYNDDKMQKIVDEADGRRGFYAPFDMVQPPLPSIADRIRAARKVEANAHMQETDNIRKDAQ